MLHLWKSILKRISHLLVKRPSPDILFCEMFNGMGSDGQKMSYMNFEIIGLSNTRAGAAMDFMDKFHKQFPKEKGVYEFVIRNPLTYDIDVVNHDNRHMYMLKGSYSILKSFDRETNVVSIVE